jgi:CRP-like cAMP-binding protein
MIDASSLDSVPLFQGLAPAARRELAARGVMRDFAADEALWAVGGEPRGVFVVIEGRVRVVASRGGRTHVLHVETGGGTLGEVPFFAGGGYPATAVAECRTRCLVLGRDALHAAMREDPELALRMLGGLAGRVRGLIGRLDAVVGSTVAERLERLLAERSARAGGGAFTLGGSQARVAEELGTTREVLARALRRLREEGRLEPCGRGSYRLPEQGRASA